MGFSLVTAATTRPVVVDEVQQYARIDTDDELALVGQLIDAAVDYAFNFHGWTGRTLTTETYDQTHDCWPIDRGNNNVIRLQRAPVQSVTSITYTDTDGNSQTLASDQYTLLSDREPSLIVPAYNVTWPTLRDVENAVTVRFVGGYGDSWNDVPQDIRFAVMALVLHWYERRDPTITGTIIAEVPEHFKEVLGKYRVWGL